MHPLILKTNVLKYTEKWEAVAECVAENDTIEIESRFFLY